MFEPLKKCLPAGKISAASGETVKPEFGCLGITDACMLRCRMCYKWKDDIFIDKRDLPNVPTVEQYDVFLGNLRELVGDDFVLNFGGGEALLFPEIYSVIERASRRRFRTNLNSNGFLIGRAAARRLAEAGLQNIKLSLDSVNRATHDYLRGREGVYDRVIQAVDNLHEAAPDMRIALISVIYEQNYREFIPLLEWINANEKIEHVLIMAAMQPNNTVPEERWWQGQYGCLWPKDAAAVGRLLERLIAMKRQGYKIINTAAQLKAMQDYFTAPERFVKKTACNMSKAVHVSSLGQIYLCFNYGILGDIKKGGDIREIWRSPQAEQVRESIKLCRKNCHFLINCFFEEDPPED